VISENTDALVGVITLAKKVSREMVAAMVRFGVVVVIVVV
jgi:hypothetical protein